MTRIRSLALASLALVALVVPASAQVWPAQPIFRSNDPQPRPAYGLLGLHERYLGRSIAWDEGLAALAARQAQACARAGRLFHSGSGVRENAAWQGAAGSEGFTFGQWASSPGHRANMLAPFTRFGAAWCDSPYGGRYWVACDGSQSRPYP
jgi:hypothetical protein